MADTPTQSTHGNQGAPSQGRPQGGRPQGGRPQGGRPQGGRPQGGRPQSGGGGRQYRGGGGPRRGGPRRRFPRRKVCRFTAENIVYIDFKNFRLLREFLTERGKIIPRRITGNSAHHQRKLTRAIKYARYMALLPYEKR